MTYNKLRTPMRKQILPPGVYIDVASEDNGLPLEFFLYDPPVIMESGNMRSLGIKPLRRIYPGGVEARMTLISNGGGTHVAEWIPQKPYINVADFLEEGRRCGFYRPCGLSPDDVSRLTSQSVLMIVHSKGHLANWKDYGPLMSCPKEVPGHRAGDIPRTMCCGYWWQDIEYGHPSDTSSNVKRATYLGTYDGRSAPGDVMPRYSPALVARLPIGGLTVVGFEENRRHSEETRMLMDAAWAAGLNVTTVE